MKKIAEADAIGDPSLLYDRLTHHDRIALETYRDARAALALIREAVEGLRSSWPGSARGLSEPGIHGACRGTGSRHLCYRRAASPE
jgi:hypothetical protein